MQFFSGEKKMWFRKCTKELMEMFGVSVTLKEVIVWVWYIFKRAVCLTNQKESPALLRNELGFAGARHITKSRLCKPCVPPFSCTQCKKGSLLDEEDRGILNILLCHFVLFLHAVLFIIESVRNHHCSPQCFGSNKRIFQCWQLCAFPYGWAV